MTLRALLAATSGIAIALPLFCAATARAEIDPPSPLTKAGTSKDGRVRVVTYDRDNPTVLTTAPGASISVQFGADETIVKVIASDQGTWAPDDDPTPSAAQMVANRTGSTGGGTDRETSASRMDAGKSPASCDPNLCRSLEANFLWLKPLRPLDPQPLHVLTKRCPGDGKPCEMVPYTFTLVTKEAPTGDLRSAVQTAAWDVRFTYPDRDRAAKAAAWRAGRDRWRRRQQERAELTPPPPAGPTWGDNRRYGYRGSGAVMPDPNGVWDDGRTTFLRFSGVRRVPNVYRELPGGKEGTTPYATEADATGTTVRIAGVAHKWIVRDGDEAGCVFPEPSSLANRSPATVAGVFGEGRR